MVLGLTAAIIILKYAAMLATFGFGHDQQQGRARGFQRGRSPLGLQTYEVSISRLTLLFKSGNHVMIQIAVNQSSGSKGGNNMASISIRMKKTSNVAGRVAHDFRKRTPKYVDPWKKYLNATLLGHPIEQDALRKNLERTHKEKTGRSRRKDSALIWEGIITFSHDADLTDIEAFDQAAIKLLDQIAERHGFNNPLWLVRHEDESRPHYHFAFTNAHADTAKPVRMSPYDMRQLQDLAGQCFEHLSLTRGKSKKQRIADNEPAHKWINRSVKQLHNDLPTEIKELETERKTIEQQIDKLKEKERKNHELLERTLKKIKEASIEDKKLQEKLQKRAETYERRMKNTEKEIKEKESELERLKKLTEPHKPKAIRIKRVVDWEEAGNFIFKYPKPILKTETIISIKDHERTIISIQKEAEERIEREIKRRAIDAERKAKQAVQEELERLREHSRRIEQEKEEIERYQNKLLKANEEASKQRWLLSAKPTKQIARMFNYIKQYPPKLVYYNATLLDYKTKLIAIGDATPIQQAAALYKASKSRWLATVFFGMNEEQIAWLVKAAEKDGYDIDFEETWAKEYAEQVRAKITNTKANDTSNDFDISF